MQGVKADPSESRSPLAYKPLHLPGESIREQITKVMEDKVEPHAVSLGVVFGLAGYSWFSYLLKIPPLTAAIVATVVGLGIVLYSFPKFKAAKTELRQLRLGREGERIVAEHLDALREQGCHVIHDFTGDKFNIDHIVVAPQGVFTIETKTVSKPKKGRAQVVYDGETITVGGFPPERDPIAQAKHQAGWLKRYLKDATGDDFKVQPVVVYPGWYVQQTVRSPRVWVLEPKALPSFINHSPVVLNETDIHLISSRLKSYLRALG